MSQDIFRRLTSESEDDDDNPDSPTEHTDVSGQTNSSSSSGIESPVRTRLRLRSAPAPSPLAPSTTATSSDVIGGIACDESPVATRLRLRSVPVPTPVPVLAPSPSTPATSSDVVGFTCEVCNKFLKTKRGYKDHVNRHRERGETAAGTRSVTKGRTPSDNTQPRGFQCEECGNYLKTKSTFLKHRISHKLKGVNLRKPTPTEFETLLPTAMKEILLEVLEEPVLEDETRTAFLQEFLAKIDSKEAMDFSLKLSKELCSIVCDKKSKLLPINQYEEALMNLNFLLNDKVWHASALQKLFLICEQKISSTLGNRLVFRISNKLLARIQCWAAAQMKSTQSSTSSQEHQEMSEEEERSFAKTLGDMFRALHKKWMQSDTRNNQTACLRGKFVESQEPVTSRSFLEKKNWFSGEESCIVVSGNAMIFFKLVQNIIKSLSNQEIVANSQNVIEELLVCPNALNSWFYLTSNYFSEDQSLLFMRHLVNVFVSIHGALDVKKRVRLENKTVRETSVALRSHLNRNYLEKDEVEN